MALSENGRALVSLGCLFLLFTLLLTGVYLNFPEMNPEEKARFKYPRNIEDAKEVGLLLSQYKEEHFAVVLCGVVVVYVMLQSFAIPGSIFLSILSGYLFPFYLALFVVCSCSSLGASICYLISNLIGRKLVTHYFPTRLIGWQAEVEKNKEHLFNYIVFLRVTPILPNWFINIASPVLNIPLQPFFWGTFLGVAPPSFVFIQAGSTLETMTHTNVAWSWTSVATITIFAIISVLPVVYKKFAKVKAD